MTSPDPSPVDKDALYGQFTRSWEQRQKLQEKALHKALDLPVDDDVNITTTNIHPPPQPSLLSSLAGPLMFFGGGAAWTLAAWLMGRTFFSPSTPPSPRSGPASPREFVVEFFTEDGQSIPIVREDDQEP